MVSGRRRRWPLGSSSPRCQLPICLRNARRGGLDGGENARDRGGGPWSLHRSRRRRAASRPPARPPRRPPGRLGGAAGRLARENAIRNFGRTGSTAAALMIGLTLVSFVAVFGKALLASDESALRDQLGTSHVITSQTGWEYRPARRARPRPRHCRSPSPPRPAATGRNSSRRRGRRQRRRPRDDREGVQLRVGRGPRPPLATLPSGGAIVREGFELPGTGKAAVGDWIVFLTLQVSTSSRPYAACTQSTATSTSYSATSSSRRRPSTSRSRARATCSRSCRRARRRTRAGAGDISRREARDRRRVHREPDGVAARRDEPLLRPARPLGDRVPLRDGEHARARRLRADARVRCCARSG